MDSTLSINIVKIIWENPLRETGVACSRNSPPSLPSHPSPSLLHRAFSEPTGVATSCINPSLFPSTSTASFLSACTSARSARALVGIHTSAALGHPGRNLAPLFSAGFLRFGGLEISTPIRPFNRGSHPFSSFGNLILA